MQNPALILDPQTRLRHAREDHARCMRLAASYRSRIASGDHSLVAQHAWALGQARSLRARHADLSRAS